MATKQELFNELLEVYTENQILLDTHKVKYLKWLDKLRTYEDVRKANRFMFNKLFLCLRPLKKIWEAHLPEVWTGLKIMNRGCDEVRTLHQEMKDFNTVWKKRPKK